MGRKYSSDIDFDDDDEKSNVPEYSVLDLSNDIRQLHMVNLQWIIEEFKIQFETYSEDLSEKAKIPFIDLAKKYASFFIRCLNEDIHSIREFGKVGLEQLKELFPDLVKAQEQKS